MSRLCTTELHQLYTEFDNCIGQEGSLLTVLLAVAFRLSPKGL